jgi:hypothetical protein
MALTLSECFEYTGMDIRRLSLSTFEEVKKIILLELKFSDEGFITIANNRYSKNDILTFFETQDWSSVVGSENAASMETAFASNWHSVLAKPGQLVTFFQAPEELFDRSQLQATKKAIELLYGSVILNCAEPLFKAGEFERLNYLLSYKPVFSDNLRYDLYRQLRVALDRLFQKMNNETTVYAPIHDVRELPFFNKAFCSIISFLNDFDRDIAAEVIAKAVERSDGHLSWKQKMELYECFLWLPIDKKMEAHIRKKLDYFQQQIEEKNATSIHRTGTQPLYQQDSLKKGVKLGGVYVGRLVVAIGLVIVVFTYIMIRTGSNGRSDPASIAASLEMKDKFTDYFFDEKEVIRDYNELKRNIENNVANESMEHFLVNQLSRYAFNKDADTLNKLTFVPIKPEPGCRLLDFSHSSDFSNVLLLIYDQENPTLPVKGALIGNETEFDGVTLYLLPTERIIAVFDPKLENDSTVVASKLRALDYLNVLFESYRINPKTTRKEFYLSTSEYSKGDASIINIYETMRMKRLIAD